MAFQACLVQSWAQPHLGRSGPFPPWESPVSPYQCSSRAEGLLPSDTLARFRLPAETLEASPQKWDAGWFSDGSDLFCLSLSLCPSNSTFCHKNEFPSWTSSKVSLLARTVTSNLPPLVFEEEIFPSYWQKGANCIFYECLCINGNYTKSYKVGEPWSHKIPVSTKVSYKPKTTYAFFRPFSINIAISFIPSGHVIK